MPPENLCLEFISSIEHVVATEWDKLVGNSSPFIKHTFLHALEQSGSVSAKTGWQPHHLLVYQKKQLVGILPLYIKGHSYGEYVFDFAWANAYQANGLEYYPKLVSAIPFTPATGQRLCLSDEVSLQTQQTIYQTLIDYINRHKISTMHWLFTQNAESLSLHQAGFLQRKSVQFHWFNQDYQSFDDFLQRFSSRKRKNVKKERQRLAQSGLQIRKLLGTQLDQQALDTFYLCYQQTYLKRSGHQGYLNKAFFAQIFAQMQDQLLVIQAESAQGPIASALLFYDRNTLYGRYWGCLHEVDGLHFECCYYQGIEFCIEHQIACFNPGTQGEHKISRGFEPIYCYSNHWIADPAFRQAIDQFIQQENAHLADYKQETESLLPFKQNE